MADIAATLYIYGSKPGLHWEIQPEKNMVIEGLEAYLSDFLLYQTNIRFRKEANLAETVKIVFTQENTYLRPQTNTWKYAKIVNSIETEDGTKTDTRYYYISGISWKSSECIELGLVLDTLNTFSELVSNEDNYSEYTLVSREHQDRFRDDNVVKLPNKQLGLTRKIDYTSEGITPVLYKTKEENIKDVNNELSWYLIYFTYQQKEQEDLFPLRLALVPDKTCFTNLGGKKYPILTTENWPYPQIDLWISTSAKEYNGEKSTAYPPSYDGLSSISIVYRNDDDEGVNYANNFATGEKGFRFTKGTDGKITVKRWYFTVSGTGEYSYTVESSGIRTTAVEFPDMGEQSIKLFSADTSKGYSLPAIGISGTVYPANNTYKLKSIDELDRTDLHLNKIIKCPYCPISITATENDGTWTITLPEDVKLFVGGEYPEEYNNFDNTIGFVNPQNIPNLSNTITTNVRPQSLFSVIVNTANEERDDDNESKLYHSDFYNEKFVYDSFNYSIQPENINTVDTSAQKIKLTTSNAMNSRFLMQFLNIDKLYSTEDYDNLMVISRNNEYPIYTSEYINYLKTGYNYDVKNKNLQNFLSIIGMGSSIGNSMINYTTSLIGRNLPAQNILANDLSSSIAASSASSAPSDWNISHLTAQRVNPAYVLAKAKSGLSGLGLLTSSLSTIISGISKITSNEWAFQQKQTQAVNQSASISASDDISLCDEYTQGLAKFCTYKVSDKVRDLLASLFYYTGYNINVREKPDIHSRKWWNYLQAEPQFKPEALETYNIADDILNNITSRINSGMTVYHRVNNTYDMAQTKENWEKFIMEAVA